ncbi:MAG: LolA-related protein, partial [Pseudomonadota bacterium]
MRHVVAGDLLALERDFRITLQGDSKLWTAHLQPQTTEAARHLDYLEMQGAGSQLLVLIVVERKGERTTTRFYP